MSGMTSNGTQAKASGGCHSGTKGALRKAATIQMSATVIAPE